MRWERVRTGLFLASLPLLLALALVTMPVWMPLVASTMRRDEKRMLAAARATACERCGRLLGPESLIRAEAFEAEYHAAEREIDPTFVRYRRVRILRAMCVGCGAFYAYSPKVRAFRLLPDDRRAWSQTFAE